jgi:hypothetical protein
MAADRAAQIARIQQMERIRQMEAERAGGALPDGRTPNLAPDTGQQLLNGLDMGAKALDYAGGAVRTTAGIPFGASDVQDLIDGLKLKKHFPSSTTMLKKAGVPEGASLSDVVPGMYGGVLAKGGAFDPSARGAAGFALDAATDPLTWVSGGGASVARREAELAAEKAAAKEAERYALRSSTRGEATQMAEKAFQGPVEVIPKRAPLDAQVTGPGTPQALPPAERGLVPQGEAGAQLPVTTPAPSAPPPGTSDVVPDAYQSLLEKTGQTRTEALLAKLKASGLGAVSAAKEAALLPAYPSRSIRALGKNRYEEGLGPLISIGDKKGKDVAEAYYRNGVSSLSDLGNTVKGTAESLKGERDAILAATDAAGGRVSRRDMFTPIGQQLDEMVANKRLTRDEATKIFSDMVERYQGGSDPTTMLATQWKGDMREGLPSSTWQAVRASRPNLANRVEASSSNAAQKEIEKTVGQTLGVKTEDLLAQKNADLGVMLDTMPRAFSYGDAAAKKSVLTPLDYLLMSGEVYHPSMAMGGVLGAKKIFDAWRNPNIQTRMGYTLRALGEDPLLSHTLDTTVRRKLADPVNDPEKKP